MSIDVEGAIPRDETLPKRKDTKQAILQGLKDNLFTILTLIGVAVGFGIGFGAGSTNPTEETILWISKCVNNINKADSTSINNYLQL